MKKFAKQVVFYSVLLGIWALVAKVRIWPPYLFPPPWGVGHALWDGFADHINGGPGIDLAWKDKLDRVTNVERFG